VCGIGRPEATQWRVSPCEQCVESVDRRSVACVAPMHMNVDRIESAVQTAMRITESLLLARIRYCAVQHQSLFESCSFATDHLDGIDQFNPLGFTEWEQASSSLALRKSGGRGRMRDRVTVWYASLCEIGTMSLHW
jgi:hypothetical protein